MSLAGTEVKQLCEIINKSQFTFFQLMCYSLSIFIVVHVWHHTMAKHDEPGKEDEAISNEHFHHTKLSF